ncbi:COMM domain-containing protein 10 [Eupeodes corollae]|uniref:COMM domain-containing protein 10 n=1 Tax=Eupeodes corollae TaxID=290404 RepID=UPI002492ABEC|nr:COMM domain-containing protein 10 [Eupeodes corollae]XP_055907787.1 COMM domain-containing protein 10 [Eupeodes corollae]
MSINWIKITERAREGIKIINSLNYDVFCTVLDYVHRNMSPNEDHNEPENALEQLEKLVGVPRADFLLLIKTFSYILKRTSTFIIKPTKLQMELRDKLKLNEDKVDAIIKLWIKNTKPILDNLQEGKYESNEIEDVAWKLNVQISSHCQQKEKTALAVLQLKTVAGEDINWEMNHDELLNLYNQFEGIQNELDAMRSSK